MGFKKILLFLLATVFINLHAFAQQDSIPLSTIVAKVQKLTDEHPFEKVHIHFDKPYYAVGDTIWFKAYVAIGSVHQLSLLSRVLYVDMITNTDSVIRSLKLPLVNGIATGDIAISRPLYKKGNYRIRAYTNWMRNFDPDYFFNKTITVGDALNKAIEPEISFLKVNKNEVTVRLLYKNHDGTVDGAKKVNWSVQSDGETFIKGKGVTDKNGYLLINLPANKVSPTAPPNLTAIIENGSKTTSSSKFSLKAAFASNDVQFFPEGGELISGVRSKVAFKAINSDGIGINVSGSIVDNSGNEVAVFTAQHAGMGIFALLPESGKNYKAVVNFPDGSKNTFDLPNVRGEGINLAVNNNDPDNISIKIATNAGFFKEYKNKGIYIIAQSGGVVYYTGLASLQGLVYTALVPKNKFPTGILQITLLAADGEPLSERVVFIQHNDALNLSLTTDQTAYTVKQHVKIAFSAKNKSLPVAGSFSVAVVDETKVPFDEDAEISILSNLLLTSDLKGYIEKPNYYFNHPDEKKLADLDVLMLTQGYRRFSYAAVIAGKYPSVNFKPEQGIDITGTLRSSTGVPVFKGNVNLILADHNINANAITDADGHFIFQNVPLNDSSKVILSARNNVNGTDLMIMADRFGNSPPVKSYDNADAIKNIDSVLYAYVQNSKLQFQNNNVLKEVVIKGNRPVEHIAYASLNGLSNQPEQVLGSDILKNCTSDFKGCVMGRIFGLFHAGEHYYIKSDYLAGNKKPVKFFINGSSVDDTYVDNMNAEDVESIEVYFKDGVAKTMDFYNCNGIISITTKTHGFSSSPNQKPDLSLLSAQSNAVTISPQGFYKTKVFYSPKYLNTTQSQQIFDRRSTIYWNPEVVTDKTGAAIFDFYNADGRGDYRVIVEGIDGDGNIGRTILHYAVK
jgi:hypothetical protein